MSYTDRLKSCRGAFCRLTGLTPRGFDRLLDQLTPRSQQADDRRKNRPGRQRQAGAGRKHTLSLADRLLMLLTYYRTYVTHACLGCLFGIDDSAVGRNINPLQPLPVGICRIPERKVALTEAAERYRNPVRRHPRVMKNVAGLHNLMFS
jgi:hypothetical protein